jgi:haloacetate dehalogenase
MALDHPHCVQRLAVLDVIPTRDVLCHTEARSALTFWPWSLLSQPSPFPETLIAACPEAVIDDALRNWGSRADSFSSEARNLYIEAMRNPASIHAICEEYRAAISLDYETDEADLKANHRIRAPLLVLWAKGGGLDNWYASLGGPVGVWSKWASAVSGHPITGGHFFPEENPLETLAALEAFLSPSW